MAHEKIGSLSDRLNTSMKTTHATQHDLAAEHARYLERVGPLIRDRLARRGKDQTYIDAYVADLPTEHVLVSILRAVDAARTRGCANQA